ncbi:unnamed protein product [Anisakis simplex]|uniref:Cation diffusion facilitator family protein 1 (inferred by orthology to a C. elegans protein) n=1 Tax=Anisakis simplex TaxID=6269 RepID=A0A0M3J0C4_ANISI|nr:unnamed protein product [Anisakis simplex]
MKDDNNVALKKANVETTLDRDRNEVKTTNKKNAENSQEAIKKKLSSKQPRIGVDGEDLVRKRGGGEQNNFYDMMTTSVDDNDDDNAANGDNGSVALVGKGKGKAKAKAKAKGNKLQQEQEETQPNGGGVSIKGGARIIIMLSMTFMFFIVEMFCGYLSHSMALIADSFHMLSDVMALLIAYVCLKMSERSSKKNTFGWVRAEVLGALINGVFLLALCFSIAIESLTRLVEPEMIKEPRQVLVVGTIGLLINIIGIFMFHMCSYSHSGHSHSHGKENGKADVPASDSLSGRRQTHVTIDGFESQHLMSSHQVSLSLLSLSLSGFVDIVIIIITVIDIVIIIRFRAASQLNMHGVFLHVLGDAIGSVIVIITALISWLVPGYEMLKLYLDPGLSLMMVCLMVGTTFPLVRETALILMQTTPGFIEIEQLQSSLLKIDGVLAVHEFHVWRLVGERIIATVHIKFSDLKAYLAAADQIRTLFHDNCIHSTTIQPEFSEVMTLILLFLIMIMITSDKIMISSDNDNDN